MSLSQIASNIFSVRIRGSLCLCGGLSPESIYHRDTEAPQSSTELSRKRCRPFTVAIAIVLGLFLGPAARSLAKEAQPNEDPQIEQRMKNLTEQLRCLVCQNETLADSHADL